MSYQKKAYQNPHWHSFAKTIRHRDGQKCLKCNRGKQEVKLQVHHKIYRQGLKPWEYAKSDCITLCSGCHAREHGHIEPNRGWTLISIDDLGDNYGTCERKGCGADLRYEHLIYHPNGGYIIVGSTCVDYLTAEDQFISSEIIKILKKTSTFLNNYVWQKRESKNGKTYFRAEYKHHLIDIWGTEKPYSFKLAIKEKGVRWYNYKNFVTFHDKEQAEVAELAFIALLGTIEEDEQVKNTLKDIYKSTRDSPISRI